MLTVVAFVLSELNGTYILTSLSPPLLHHSELGEHEGRGGGKKVRAGGGGREMLSPIQKVAIVLTNSRECDYQLLHGWVRGS